MQNKEKYYFKDTFKERVGKPKDLRKNLKSLSLCNKSGGCIIRALAENQVVKHDIKAIKACVRYFLSNFYFFTNG